MEEDPYSVRTLPFNLSALQEGFALSRSCGYFVAASGRDLLALF